MIGFMKTPVASSSAPKKAGMNRRPGPAMLAPTIGSIPALFGTSFVQAFLVIAQNIGRGIGKSVAGAPPTAA